MTVYLLALLARMLSYTYYEMSDYFEISTKCLFRDKYIISITIFASFICVLLSFLTSILYGICILIISIGSICGTYFFFSDKKHLPNFLCYGHCDKEVDYSLYEQHERKYNEPFTQQNSQMYINFKVAECVDEALEEFLNLVLDNFVYNWYKEITVHDQLADEIRYIIRRTAASLGYRICKVDINLFILDKVLPIFISHLDAYIEGNKRMRGNTSIESAVIKYFQEGNGLHIALRSRQDEVAYLKAISTTFFPYLVPDKYLKSNISKIFLEDLVGEVLLLKGLDLLALPNTTNLIFILLLEDEQLIPKESPTLQQYVPLLKNFASVNTHPRNSVLRCNVSSVLKNQNLLHHFQSFLNEEGGNNVLQFCLAVEDFNRDILDPDLTALQLEHLQGKAFQLYQTYMSSSALEKVHFPENIIAQIWDIINSESENIVKLRTTRPLFQAYEYAYNLLEKEYLPLFVNSLDYFGHICGLKDFNECPRSANTHRRSDSSSASFSPFKSRVSRTQSICDCYREHDSLTRPGIGKTSSKLTNNPFQVSKQMGLKPSDFSFNNDVQSFVSQTPKEFADLLMSEEGSSLRCQGTLESFSHAFRDLSAWRVSIPKLEPKYDSAGKLYYAFIVNVTRIDVIGDNIDDMHWEVERKYHEFYILETKLTEFHGEFNDNQLPPRRSLFSSRGLDFMHSRKEIFEEFLQKLLQTPALKNSQLLFLFLKSKDEFTTTYLPEVSIGRFIRDVPKKLIKEKGQHLDSFIATFLNSTSLNKDEEQKIEKAEEITPDYHDESVSLEKRPLLNTAYRNNAQSLPLVQYDFNPILSSSLEIKGVFDSLLFIGVRAYGMSLSVVRWCMCLKAVIGSTFDTYCCRMLHHKLSQSLSPFRIAKYIHVLKDALFFDPPLDQSEVECRKKEKHLKKILYNLVPFYIKKLIFNEESYAEGTNTVIDVFQHPILNKQLSYMLLDVVLVELFPEVINAESVEKCRK